jgi:hypothetical protein
MAEKSKPIDIPNKEFQNQDLLHKVLTELLDTTETVTEENQAKPTPAEKSKFPKIKFNFLKKK